MTTASTAAILPWHRREDTWAVFIALGLVLGVTLAFFLGAGRAVSATALSIPTWSEGHKLVGVLSANPFAPLALFALFLAAFSGASLVLGWNVIKYSTGFAVLFAFSARRSTPSSPIGSRTG